MQVKRFEEAALSVTRSNSDNRLKWLVLSREIERLSFVNSFLYLKIDVGEPSIYFKRSNRMQIPQWPVLWPYLSLIFYLLG